MAEPLSPATRILGERVRAGREALGLSQEALAHQTGVHWTFLGQVERGRRNLSVHNLLKIAMGLGVDPADLVRGLQPPAD
jgi:transcriptional regulator with XRE-family HTH domain